MKKGFRYEIAPNEEQKEFLNKTLGCSRFVYNKALAQMPQYREAKVIMAPKYGDII